MAEIINLRRAKKRKARHANTAAADANRAKHGIAKPLRDFAKTRQEKEQLFVDAHKLEDKE